VVTLGASGAHCWDGEAELHSPGFVLPVVDPTGAGDAFRAGFLAACLFGSSVLTDVLDFANATAALKCRAVGAQTGLPTRAEVLGLLTDRGVRRSNRAGSTREAGHP
jgi:ribokinase